MTETETRFTRKAKQVLEVSSIQSLLILATCPENDIQLQALDRLLHFTENSPKNKESFLGSKSLDPILDLYHRTSDNNLKKKCISLLSSATDGINHTELGRVDLIKTLVNALKSNVIEMQDEAAFGLANIAKDQINKFEIKRLGGISALTDCLIQKDPDVLLNSLRALEELFEDAMNKIEFRRINGIVRLIHLIDSDYVEICLVAFNCLLKLAKDDQTLIELKNLQFLPKILNVFMRSTNDSMLQITIQTLTAILKNRDILNEFPHYFPNNAIVDAFRKDVLKKDVLLLLAVVSEKKENRLLLNESGINGKITELLGSNDFNLSSGAALVLANMVQEERVMNELTKPTNQEYLGKLLSSDNQLVKRAALLLTNAYIIKKSLNVNGIPNLYTSIVNHMQSDDPTTVINASQCICNLSKSADIRMELIKAGLVSTLIAVIEIKSQLVSIPATLALSVILQEEAAREFLLKSNSKVLEKLVDNVTSPMEDLCRNSILALGNASKTESISREVSQKNGIDNLLQAINNPIMNLSHIAKSTLFKVIEHNSKAKYWLTNNLSDKNMIEDGFIDIGYAGKYFHSIHKLPKREELQDKKGYTFYEVNFKSDSKLEVLLSEISENIQKKSTLEQFQVIADIVISTMGGIKPVEILEKQASLLISDLKKEQNSSILKLGSLTTGSFYHRALLFKTLCDRLGLGPCGMVRRNNKMAWNTIEKSKVYSYPSATSDAQVISSLSDSGEPSFHATSDDYIVDLIFNPGSLLYGKEADEYIKYYG